MQHCNTATDMARRQKGGQEVTRFCGRDGRSTLWTITCGSSFCGLSQGPTKIGGDSVAAEARAGFIRWLSNGCTQNRFALLHPRVPVRATPRVLTIRSLV